MGKSSFIKNNRPYLLLCFLFFLFGVGLGAHSKGITINKFDLGPRVFCTNSGGNAFAILELQVTDINQFFSTCGNSANSFDWAIKEDRGLFFSNPAIASGKYVAINFSSLGQIYNLSQPVTLTPALNQTSADYYAEVYCGGAILAIGNILDTSVNINVIFGDNLLKWACITSNNTLTCSPGNFANLSDTPACAGRQPIQIGSNLCNQSAVGASCNTGSGGGGIPPPVNPGQGSFLSWKLTNPLAPLSSGAQPQNVVDVIILITDWILNIAMVLIVGVVIYGGIMFLISAGNPGKIQQAKNILFWALVGFLIVLIGKGFVFLIESVLNGQIPIIGT